MGDVHGLLGAHKTTHSPPTPPEKLPADFDAADFLHALLAFLLFFEQLAFAGDVTPVGLRDLVLT